jgi:flagellar export protein FliJ
MAFHFPLAIILKLRESVEEREERALQRIQAEMVLVEYQIEEQNELIANAIVERERILQNLAPAYRLQAVLGDAQSAEDKKQMLFEQLHLLEQQRQQQVKVYQAAHRDRETLTNMSDAQRGLYELERARTEQKNIDDVFMARHHRS